jgi:hypothetical protein
MLSHIGFPRFEPGNMLITFLSYSCNNPPV